MKAEVTESKWMMDSGGAWVSFKVSGPMEARAICDSMEHDKRYTIDLKVLRNRRSLDANAYFWVLVGKLAEAINLPKEEIYRDAIKRIGGNHDIVCVQDKAVDKLCESWENNGIGWQTETFESKIEGCTNVILYYGSSTYDSRQMYILISNIVEECKNQGIETMNPQEISNLISMWESSNKTSAV